MEMACVVRQAFHASVSRDMKESSVRLRTFFVSRTALIEGIVLLTLIVSVYLDSQESTVRELKRFIILQTNSISLCPLLQK
jgi:hypothetical protein